MAKSLLFLIARLFRWRKGLLIRFVATSVGRAATSMAVIFLIREFLSTTVSEPTFLASTLTDAFGASGAIWAAAGLLLATYLCGALLFFDNQIIVQRIIKVIELGLMERLIRHLLVLSVPFSDHQSHGEIIQTLRADVTHTRMVVHAFANMVLEAMVVVSLILVATSISPSLALWVLLVLPIVSLPVFLISRQLRVRSHRVRKSGYVLFDMVLEILKGMRVIKAYRGEDIQLQKALEKGRTFFDELIHMVRLKALGRVGMESLAGLSVVVVILVGGFHMMEGAISWPSLLAFVMAVRVMHTPLHLIHKQYVEIQSWHASILHIAEFLQKKPQIVESAHPKRLEQPPREIRMERLGFSYGPVRVLEDISFRVEAGETIGIVGPSGAGKSTLLNLLIRLYDPTEGRVSFDGHDLREFQLSEIYAKVAIVAQEPFLFSTTVAENIRCGRPEAGDDEVIEAARAACIHDEILAMADGYETVIGVGGREVSRGQAQRINVARAFLKNAPILLLDEATSSLDSVAEHEMQHALDRLLERRTSFVVAHRLSTLRHADRLLVLERGRLVGDGPHEELLATCDLYRRLWESQLLATPS